MAMPKPKRVNTAVWLLYAVSVLGILELFSSATIKGETTPLIALDIVVYLCLILIAFAVGKGMGLAKILYIILAIVWYIVAIFYLPTHYAHDLNAGLIFIQLVMTIAAVYMLYQPKSVKWFRSKDKLTTCS
jgi:hypothetical protein